MINLKCISVMSSVLCVLCVVKASVLKSDLFSLDIIHYNDFHDRFEETSVNNPICTSNNTACLGGFARLAHEVKALLLQKPDALLLNAGDSFQGTYWYTYLKWNVTQRFMNVLPHDAHTIGNHEFDDGIEGLAPYLAALHAPVVVANINTTREPKLQGLYKPHIILERKGKKIGIIGVTTPESRILSQTENVIFLDPVKVVQEQAKLLTKKGVNIIVVLSHCGLQADKEIAKEAGGNVDVIVGAHSHSLLWNGPAPSGEVVTGPYPVIVASRSNPGHKVLIVQASANTKYLGNITLYLDSQGELVSYDAGPVFLNRSIPEDSETKALLAPYAEILHAIVNEPVGYTNDELSNSPCFKGECAIGDFIIDAFINATRDAFPSNYTNVGFIIANVIRASLDKGVITRASLINQSPFSNKVVSVDIAGRYIVEALEKGFAGKKIDGALSSGLMPVIAGMQVVLNITCGKAVSVYVEHETGRRPLDLDEVYRVTTIGFLYHGGHNFNKCVDRDIAAADGRGRGAMTNIVVSVALQSLMFQAHGRNLLVVGIDAPAMENYIRKVTPLNDKVDNRLVIIK